MPKSVNLGDFEQLALLAMLRLGKDAYGASIQRELEGQAGREASISAIHITLARLETKGMISSRMGKPTRKRGGKARRFFKLEPDGLRALGESRQRLIAMWDGVQDALKVGGQ